MQGTLSEAPLVETRRRICDLGYLREAYRDADGAIGWRCPAEPVDDYLRKGGNREDTVGRKCICNALMASVGLGQVRPDGTRELPLITSGDDVATVARFGDAYRALDERYEPWTTRETMEFEGLSPSEPGGS